MITKESLIAERESINETVLKIKQKYSNSPSSKQAFIIVEGKDDITFYGMKAENCKSNDLKVFVISAGNRYKVVETYKTIDWSKYSKSKILFVIDRDLSDYTNEETPKDDNVYVTDNYSIENDICTKETFVRIVKYLSQIDDINEKDESEISLFYDKLEQAFFEIATPIMALILYWKTEGILANYSNVNFKNILRIENNCLCSNFSTLEEMLIYFCDKSNISYDDSIILEPYIEALNNRHLPIHYIRGKYLACFFSVITNHVIKNLNNIISSKKECRTQLNFGPNEIITKFSGYARIPNSLEVFLNKLSLIS